MAQAEMDRPVSSILDGAMRNQLEGRRQRLRNVLPAVRQPEQLQDLLQQIDAALQRMDAGTYGICETCHESVEKDRLLADPLCRNCLDHLSPAEQRALERDLDLAYQVQRGLLPETETRIDGWSVAYHYEPAGAVSGDYCDLIPLKGGEGLFLIGDVSGKGVAASMLMANLHAIFQSLAPVTRSVTELVCSANRVFSKGALTYFATLACGRFHADGAIEVCNAGHCFPLHVSHTGVKPIESTGIPLGIADDGAYGSQAVKLSGGDKLVLYTDGLSEAFNGAREQYGIPRLTSLLECRQDLGPRELLAAILEDLKTFRAGAPKTDDLTIMVVRRQR
jgi:sigma-B regulation protein RsbU (phosphoserine phosphatase)